MINSREFTTQQCNVSTIESYLSGELPSEEQDEFENHLSSCASCRQSIEAHAAEPSVWQEVRSLLVPQSSSVDSSHSCETADNSRVQPGMMVLDALSPTDDPEMLGRFGEYEISGIVGVGGMGAVLRGYDKSLRRVVAIKVMAPHLADSGPARTRFQREARAAAAITHDNVIDIHGVAEANGLPYIVMPFARGPSLQSRIDSSGPLAAVEVVRIGKQIAAGLAAAHEQGLVHRDIKPANILLNLGIERLWITDFGVAHAMDDASMTKTGVIAGTPQYMSPEQARGEAVDYRSDLFSLGSVLYTACTGRAPFRAEAAYGILRRITDTDPMPIREISPEIPDWLVAIISRLMAKHPGDRFETAAEVASLLEDCLAHMQQPTQVPLPPCLKQSIERPESAAPQLRQTARPGHALGQSAGGGWRRLIAIGLIPLSFVALAAILWQATVPVDISGTWKGEQWSSVSLSSVEEASGWYNGTFTDADGSQGAIQLEWSRLTRRYTGRWKSADERSGNITLRAGANAQLRGAISADPDSQVLPGVPRLRDLSWQRSNPDARKPNSTAPLDSPTVSPESFAIAAPDKGLVVRIVDGISVGKQVMKGDLIAVIEPMDAERTEQLRAKKTDARIALETNSLLLPSKATAIETAKENIHASRQRLAAYEAVMNDVLGSADASLEVEISKLEAAKAQLASSKTLVEQLKKEYAIAEDVVKQGLVSIQELNSKRTKVKAAEAKVAEAESFVQSRNNERRIKERERSAKEARALIDISDAKAALANAENSLAQAEAELQLVQSNVTNAQSELERIEQQLGQVKRIQVFSPVDGKITSLAIFAGKTLMQGETVCVIVPHEATANAEPSGSPTSQDRPTSSTPFALDNLQSANIPPNASGSGQGLLEALESAAGMAGRIRELQNRLNSVNSELAHADGPQQDLRDLSRQLGDQKAGIQRERETIIRVLQNRLAASQKLYELQAEVTDQTKLSVDAGKVSEFDFLLAKHSLIDARRDLTLMTQLLEFYSNIEELDTATEEKRIIEMLRKSLEESVNLFSLQSDIAERLSTAYEFGKIPVGDVLAARKDLAKIQAEQGELQLLLEYYEGPEKKTAPKQKN